jgi:hypothetical protein
VFDSEQLITEVVNGEAFLKHFAFTAGHYVSLFFGMCGRR